jgi:hypothetical protein
VKVAVLETTVIDDSDNGMSLTLSQHPADVPKPFASVLREHLASRLAGTTSCASTRCATAMRRC